MPSKTLVLTSCCKEKLDHAAPAKDLYQGALFQLVKQYAIETGSDWRVLSAKYGLVEPDQVLEPYDLQLRGRAMIDSLQQTVLPALAAIWNNYALVVVIMGIHYRKVIYPILHRQGYWKLDPHVNVAFVHDERGIGGLLQKVKWCIAELHGERKREKELGNSPDSRHTRISSPDTCKTCMYRNQSFNQFRRCGLPNGDDNPLSTPCDYCCKWDGVPNPDHYHKDRTVNSMAEQPKTDEKKEPEPSEYGYLCGACEKPIKPGTPGMRQHPFTRRWYHPEEYPKNICSGCGGVGENLLHDCIAETYWCATCWGSRPGHASKKPAKEPKAGKGNAKPAHNLPLAKQQELTQETAEYPYEKWPLAADGENDLWGALAIRNIARGESWTREETIAALRKWNLEHPLPVQPKSDEAGQAGPKEPGHKKPSEDLYECIACNKEFPESEMHEDRDGERWCKPCWAAEHPRQKRARKEEASSDSTEIKLKVLRLRGAWIYLDEQHLNELEDQNSVEGEALGKILYAYKIPFDIVGPTKAQMIAAILAAPVGGIMGEHVEGKTIPFQEDLDRALHPDVKAVCDACHQPIYRDEGMIVQGSTSPVIPFHANCHPKDAILYHCVFDCDKFRDCKVHYVKGCREYIVKASAADEARLRLTAQERARAGQRLYQIFAMHATQIAPLLSKEEQVEMNKLQEALNFE